MKLLASKVAWLLVAAVALAACGSSNQTSDSSGAVQSNGGIRIVTPNEASDILSEPPNGLVVLDVRTPEEFAAGHLEGATMIDFYANDFVDRVAELDPNVPYLLYCRSGNRSGQARNLMSGLGFSDIADIDGGIAAWTQAGLPTAG